MSRSRWYSFNQAQVAFEQITPGVTATNELAQLGFDPVENPNVRILTYLDILQRFMPNPSITVDDLDPAVRLYLEGRDKGQAWEVEVQDTRSRRYGNAFLDITGFVKKTRETGWEFKALLLIHDGRVIYKLSSGQPKIDRHDKKVRPLGPLQELDGLISRSAGRFY